MSFKITEYKIQIELLSGLHIGGGDTGMGIGGVDSEVIKHPVTKQPYIPGSSLKGKVRSLLEYEAGIRAISKNGTPFSLKDYEKETDSRKQQQIGLILKLFGTGGDKAAATDIGITRLSFSDAAPTDDNNKESMTEVKAENSISRISGTASNPRFIERVHAGAIFEGFISMRVFEGDNEDEFCNKLANGLWLLTKDSLGGSGSRGYGRVKISILSEGKLKESFERLH